MPWLRGIASGGGGGSTMATGRVTLKTSMSNEYTIETGIINLTGFHIHGIKDGSNVVQNFTRWESSYGDNFYYLYRVSTTYGAGYGAFSSTQATDWIKIKSIDTSTGTVTIVRPAAGSWYTTLSGLNTTWWAY